MNPLSYLFAPMLLLPVAALPTGVPIESAANSAQLTAESQLPASTYRPVDTIPFSWVAEVFRSESAGQVSIEQRIIIRIAPRASSPVDPRRNLLAELPNRSVGPHFEERNMAKCVPVGGIAGVQILQSNKLTLFMRDRTIVSAGLDKGCNAQDYYSGFYVERSSDGMMCSGRDTLKSRSGASCKLGKLKQLVEVGN